MTDFAIRVSQYVRLRDEIKKRNDAHKESIRELNETLEQLGCVLLQGLNAANADSVATPAGTVYKTQKKSASVVDMAAFWEHVVAGAAWDLVDRKANVTAVEDYIKEHQEPPPGVNFSSRFEVGVRRK